MSRNPPQPPPADRLAAASPASFYNAMANSYDRMVGFDARVQVAGRLVRTLIERFAPAPRVGIDLGCGTGAYTCALAAAGLAAGGLDVAEDMLTQGRANAARLGLSARFVTGELEALPTPFPMASAGLVLCLGNTLPHLLEPVNLARAFRGIAALLAPTGLAVIQTLNYDRILDRQERIVSVDRDAASTFVRFYDFLDNGHLRFNILRVTWEADQARPEPLLAVPLHPYRCAELQHAAIQAGLQVVLTAGDAALSPYDCSSSDTVLLLLRPTLRQTNR